MSYFKYFICLFFICSHNLYCNNLYSSRNNKSFVFNEPSQMPKFGYISYSTTNIGDDIQAIAAKRFLPKNSFSIDRDFISKFTNKCIVSTIVNGWYMHTKDNWYRNDMRPPKNSWPPSSSIDPLLISIYLWPNFVSTAFSDEGLEYFKKHAPIGARDYYTLDLLQKKGIPSYFSGCLTLTLDNNYKGKRKNIIYAVDIDKECLNYLKKHTNSKVIVLAHGVPSEIFRRNNKKERLEYAEKILNKYKKAKCVVTQRLHAAMPCLALETPILLIAKHCDRFSGLRELVFHCSKKEFINGEFDFDFNNPPENPKDYLPIRENLIKTVKNWINSKMQRNYF